MTTKTPGPAGSAIATQLTGSGFHSPGPPSADTTPGDRTTPAPAAAAPARPGESRGGSGPRPAGESLLAAQAACPHLTTNMTGSKCADCGLRFPQPGFDLPQRPRQPRFERTCDCLGCKPFVSG